MTIVEGQGFSGGQVGAANDAAEDIERVNILIVDDLPEKLLAYEVILEELGQNLVAVRSGEEALKLVLREDFAVILLDVNMPGMDGFETASLIRRRRKSAHTPIIFLTAFADEMRMAQGYASGAVDYLPTPVVPEILKAKVRVFIELSQMRRQAASQAEERALRRAAEESARRSEFLVGASAMLVGSQNRQEIMRRLVEISIPVLADISLIYLKETEGEEMPAAWAWEGAAWEVESGWLDMPLGALPWLEHAWKGVRHSAHTQVVTLPEGNLCDENAEFFSKYPESGLLSVKFALALPLTIRGKVNGMLVFGRREQQTSYVSGNILLAEDLASRASVALENAMLLQRIQDSDRRKDEFLAMLAHELRNPLAPIQNALQIMRLTKDARLHGQAHDTIERQVKHMTHLIDDLLDISRITQGKIELNKTRTLLSEVLSHAIETAQPLINLRQHHLEVVMPEKPVWFYGDAARVSQIFSNLLNNAAKYTNSGGRISVVVEFEEDVLRVRVCDNGIGIPPEMLRRVFEMFMQVDNSLERSQGGLGIGLTLVKSLVEMHGGKIEAESGGRNGGSEFIVTLPVLNLPASPEAAQNPEKSQLVETASPQRVLVVDDNEAAARTMGLMIELVGHTTMLAHDGPSAMEIAREKRPSVVLLDIGLPGMSGYEVCKAMRSDPVLKDAILIAQTGWGQEEHRRRSKEAGFDYHLIKPVDMWQLHTLIDELTAA